MMKDAKDIKKNGLLNNLIYFFGIWGKSYPFGIFLIILSAPVRIGVIYQIIRIPKIIVEGFENNLVIEKILFSVFITGLILIGVHILVNACQANLMSRGSRPVFYLYSVPINNKLFSLNYQTLIKPEIQAKITKIKNMVVYGDSAGSAVRMFGFNFSLFLTALIGIVLFSSGILMIDKILLIIILFSGVVNLLYGRYTGKYTRQNIIDRSDDEKKENYILTTTESPLFAKDIRLYNMKNWILKKFMYYNKRHNKYLTKESNVKIFGSIINASLIFLRDIFAYIYLIHKLASGNILISQFVFLIGVVMEFSKWMDAIVMEINNLILFNTDMDQFRDFINLENEIKEGNLTVAEVSQTPSIEFKNISYRYSEKDKWIFKDFNLKIKAGEKIALVGINGAGKTTLMHILMGLLEPKEGEILIDGIPSYEFKKSEYYNLFSPVFQDINIFPETISANIAGTDHANPEQLKQAIKLSGIDEMLEEFPDGINSYLVKTSRDKAIDLSGGQSQKMLLARSIYKNGKINILDEPTAALDPIAENKIYEEYDKMSKNKTSIFISHRLASTKFCNRIIMLENGKIIEEGSHNDLIEKNGKYGEMYQVQSTYYH